MGNLEEALREIRSLLDTGRMPDAGVGRTGLPAHSADGLPELWVAAHSPRALRLTGRYADGWLPAASTPENYADMLKIVSTAAAVAGRPTPTAALFPVTLLGESRGAVVEILENAPAMKLFTLFSDGEIWARHGVEHPNGRDSKRHDVIPHEFDPDQLRELAPTIPIALVEETMMIGNAEDVSARIMPFHDAGAQYVVLADFTGTAYAAQDAAPAFAEFAKLVAMLQGT